MKKVIALLLALCVMLSFAGCFGSEREVIVITETPYPELFSPGNPYAYYYDAYRSYILPDSCSAYLCWADISSLSDEERYLAQQEIYARYGLQFNDPYLTEYFSAQAWYTPSTMDVTDQLSQQATMNLFLFDVYAAVQDNSIQDWYNPYIPLCSADDMLPESSIRSLTDGDLRHLSGKELVIARNEIFARHGYIFSDYDLRTYFYTKPWYRPSTPSSDFDFGSLSALESANVELIQRYEDNAPATTPGDNSNGNQGNHNGSIPDNVTVVDQYTYLLGNRCYHIPYVDLPSAASINQKMYDACYNLLQQHVFSYPDQPLLLNMAYSIGRSGDVVSVMVYAHQDWNCDVILVYNFSASTGRTLSSHEVFAVYGMSEEEGRNQIRSALEAYWEPHLTNPPGGYVDFAQTCKERTLADSNVAAWMPYIDASGNLCFTGTIYSVAGAESYEHLLDQSGNDLPGLGCAIH